MTEPVGVDAAMVRLEQAVAIWRREAPPTALYVVGTPTTVRLLADDLELLLGEVQRLRAQCWNSRE